MAGYIAREGKAFDELFAGGRHDIEFERVALPGDGVQASAFDLRLLLEGVGEDLEYLSYRYYFFGGGELIIAVT